MPDVSIHPQKSRKNLSSLLSKFRDVFSILWPERKFIVKYTVVIIVLSVIVSLVWPKSYLSTTTMLPQADQNDLSSLMGLSGLASLSGLSLGQTSLQPLYPDIVKSEIILRDVIYTKYKTREFSHPVNLIEYWDLAGDTEGEQYDRTLEKLRKKIDVDDDRRTDLVTINLVMPEPHLAADILNKIDSLLDDFIRNKRITNASEQRKWIERRLVEVQDSLAESENVLTQFQEQNRVLASSPELMLKQQRLARDVQMNNEIYLELKKQVELAKIQELKDVQYVNILDVASPANIKYRPPRAIMVIVLTFLGCTSLFVYVYLSKVHKSEIVAYFKSLFAPPAA